ncbi:MAG: c-type cytochrome biogenesis protein CcmI [Gammaproteobacteria bacterium]|nr:c-type cytochrome biogenesis protein CcmI [Gammaproteobacteria bacterium]
MTIFWGLAGIMVMVALLFTLPWILRSSKPLDTDLDALNTEVIKTQLAELEADLNNGRIDQTQYLAARQDLERELLVDLSGPSAGNAEVKVRGGRWAALVLMVLIPGVTIGLYHYIGTQEIIPLLAKGGAAPARMPTQGAHSLEEMVERLAERLRQEPDNAEGWAMLARSYTSLERFGDAAVAYAKAHQLAGDQAGLLADYADALVMANGREFTDQAGALLMKALETEPGNVKALWLTGHWKNQQGDYAEAIRYWQRAAEQLTPGGEDALVIAQQISQARERLAPGVVVEAPTPRQEAATVTPAVAAADKAISVSVTLDPQVAAGAAAQDTVFIFARAVSGPRMPLAIVRKQVSDLPVTVTLDDSTAMAPSMKLSNFDQVVVGARISKSGTAMPQSGDLQGLVAPVVPGAGQAIELNIDSRIP